MDILKNVPGTKMQVKLYISGQVQIHDYQAKTYINDKGYKVLECKFDGETKIKRVDKLVYRLFKGNHKKSQPNLIHLDGDKKHIHLKNLDYLSDNELEKFNLQKEQRAAKGGGGKGKEVKVTDTHSKKENHYKSFNIKIKNCLVWAPSKIK